MQRNTVEVYESINAKIKNRTQSHHIFTKSKNKLNQKKIIMSIYCLVKLGARLPTQIYIFAEIAFFFSSLEITILYSNTVLLHLECVCVFALHFESFFRNLCFSIHLCITCIHLGVLFIYTLMPYLFFIFHDTH